MAKTQTPVDVVTAALGVRPLARQLNISPSAITKWRKRGGLVPNTYHRKILELSEGQLTADDLVYGRES